MRTCLLLFFILIFDVNSYAQCDNLTDGGIIGYDEVYCTGFDPDPIVNVISPSGGSGTIEYMWIQTTTPSSFGPSDAIPGVTSDSYDPTYISETTYFIRCARRAGCDSWVGESMVVKEINPLYVNVASNDIGCDSETGNIMLSVYGGTPPYSYEWDGTIGGSSLTVTTAGIYNVVITDASGCTISESIEIEDSNLEFEVFIEDLPCINSSDYAEVIITDGVGPFSIYWSNGDFGSTLDDDDGLTGLYTVTVVDATDCSLTKTIEFDSGEAPIASIGCCADTVICEGSMASIEVELTGASPWVLTYKINDETFTDSISSAPYFINFFPSETSTITLESVSNYCSFGEVCGKAFIAVNECDPESCETGCFYSTTEVSTTSSGCLFYEITVYATGCRKDLSNLTIGIPCGSISDLDNSHDFPIFINYSPDPHSGLTGIKVDDISGIGEYDPLTISFKVCPEECEIEFPCYPVIAYKYSTCVDFEKTGSWWDVYSAGNNPTEIKSSPNPFSDKTTISIKGGRFNQNYENGSIVIIDPMGKQIRTIDFKNMSYSGAEFIWDGKNDEEIEVGSGLYYITFVLDGGFEKATTKVYKK